LLQTFSIDMEAYIQITIDLQDKDLSDMLVAMLSEAGYEGFEESDTCLKAFIGQEHFDPQSLQEILFPTGLIYRSELIPFANWNARWESHFAPVLVGKYCAVRASFHEPVSGVDHEIIITPKMSFGTGHHATTYMMIEQMQKINFQGKNVLDFGTGTGVLAILAEQSGADAVLAIDNDPLSIDNAAENLIENKCRHATLQMANSLAGLGVFDVIVANINKNVILEHMANLQQHLSKQGVLLLSGLLTDDRPEINIAATINGFTQKDEAQKDGWICIRLQRAD